MMRKWVERALLNLMDLFIQTRIPLTPANYEKKD